MYVDGDHTVVCAGSVHLRWGVSYIVSVTVFCEFAGMRS